MTARVDKLWEEGFQLEDADFGEPCHPVLTYHKGSEVRSGVARTGAGIEEGLTGNSVVKKAQLC